MNGRIIGAGLPPLGLAAEAAVEVAESG